VDPPSGCPFHTRCWLAPTLPEARPDPIPSYPPTDRPDAGLRLVPPVCDKEAPALVAHPGADRAGSATGAPAAHVAACHFARELVAAPRVEA
jgi:hypothetical protein